MNCAWVESLSLDSDQADQECREGGPREVPIRVMGAGGGREEAWWEVGWPEGRATEVLIRVIKAG